MLSRLSSRLPRSLGSRWHHKNNNVASDCVQRSTGHLPLSARSTGVECAISRSNLISTARFTTSRRLAEKSSPESGSSSSMKDPHHPSLYYHLISGDETRHPMFALSFLESAPSTAESSTILGWLPAVSTNSDGGKSGINDFVENKKFVSLLHEAVKAGLSEDDIWKNGAIQVQSGWMHIFDQRNPPPLGRIPETEDIISSVRVEDGQMILDTYQPMPSYRLCTREGVCQLTETLMIQLLRVLRRIVEDEKRGS